MAVVTEVFEGQFNISEEGVEKLTALLSQLDAVAKKVGASLGKITIKIPKVDTSSVDSAVNEASEKVKSSTKKTSEQSAAAIKASITQIDTLIKGSTVANESLSKGIRGVSSAAQTLASARSFKGIVDGAQQAQVAVGTLNDTFSNVRAGIELATRDGGNKFLGIRQAIFGTSNSTNVLARALDTLGSSTLKTSNATDLLAQNAQRITSQMAQFNQAMSLGTLGLKGIAKEEGVSIAGLSKLDVSIQKTGNEFVKLNDTITATGKITPRQLAQVSNRTNLLLKQVQDLIGSGIVPLNTQTGQALIKMETELKNNVTAAKTLTAQMRAIPEESSKITKAHQKSGQELQKNTSIVDKAKTSFNSLFSRVQSGSQSSSSSIRSMGNELQNSSFKANLLSETLGTVFGNVLFSLISKATGAINNFFGSFQRQFLEVNNLAQNFELTLTQMMTGLDTDKVDAAIENIDQFIRKTVAKTPFEFADAQQSFQRLITAGFDPKLWLTPVADAAAAVNKPMEQLIGALQRIQVGSKGIGVDMLRDFGIPVNQVGSFIDKLTGQTLTLDQVFKENGDITKLNADQLSAMGIEFKKLEFDKQGALVQTSSDALSILNGFLTQNTAFSGAAEARSKTLTGVLSNLKDVISILSIEAGKPIFEKVTNAGQGLLNFIGVIQPSLERLAAAIGIGISNAIDFATGKFAGFQFSVDGLIAIIDNLTLFISAVFSGDWVTAWDIFSTVVDSAVTTTFDLLNDLVTDAFNWGASFVAEIANGVIDAASSLLADAMTYVGDIVASFMAPGSAPEEGPLSTMDAWGKGLMDTFTDSMANVDTTKIQGALGEVRNLFDKFDLGAAQSDVLAIQQQIIDAEAAGFVPASLKKQLQLAQDKVELIQAQEQAQKELGKEAEDTLKKERGGAVSEASKGGGPSTGDKEAKGKVSKEKQTAVQIKDTALAILDQQLKDGVIKYEDYAKERLKIEEKFYQDTLEEGGTVAKQNIDNIKHYQSEVERLAEERKKKKGEEDIAPIAIPSARDVLEGFSTEIADVGDKAATTLINKFNDGINKNFGQVKNNLINRLKGLGSQLTAKITEFFTPSQPALVALTGGYEQAQSPFQTALAQINEFITFIKTNMPIVQATFLTVWEVIKSSATVAFALLKTTYDTTLKPAFDELTKTLDGLGITWPEIFAAIGQATVIVMGIIGAIILGAVIIVTSLINGIVAGAANIISAITNMSSSIGQQFTGLVQIIVGVKNFFVALFAGDLPAAFAAFKLVSQGIVNFFVGGFKNILNAIDLFAGTALDIVLGFADGVIKFFTNLYNELVGESIIPDMVTAILLAVTGLTVELVKLIGQMVVDGIDKFEEMADEWVEAGKNIILGILNGINKNKDKVLEVLKSLIGDAVDGITSFLGIKSPSILFRDMGINIIEGLNEGINATVPSFIDAIGSAADDAEKILDEMLPQEKASAVLKSLKAVYRANFDEINALGRGGSGVLFDKLLKAVDLSALGVGEDAYGIIQHAGQILINQTYAYGEQQSEAFLSGQTNLFKNIQKSAADALEPFNQQFFNIQQGATQARIDLEKLFNRTVTNDEVENLGKALEGIPIDKLNDQQRLIYRNYILQKKLAGAAEQEAKVREAILKLGEKGQVFQSILEKMGLAEAPGAAQDTGNQITEALGLGIDAGLEEVLASLGSVSDSIIDKIKTALGIASPSTVFVGFGENLMGGLREGILSGIANVDTAIKSVNEVLVSGIDLKALTDIPDLKIGAAALSAPIQVAAGASPGGRPIQLTQHNTIGDEFDMAVFTARTQQAVVEILRSGR